MDGLLELHPTASTHANAVLATIGRAPRWRIPQNVILLMVSATNAGLVEFFISTV